MATPETKQLLIELGKSPFGRPLRDYLNEKLTDLDSVSDCKTWEETLGRKHAVELIKNLFVVIEDKRIETKTKNQYI